MNQTIDILLRKYEDPARTDAEAKYSMYRQMAYKEVYDTLRFPQVRYKLDEIGIGALRTFESEWKYHPARPVSWDWLEQAMYWRRKRHSRLELSIWHERHLCGLMLGNCSRRKKIVYIQGIEGAPYRHPLQGYIMEICLEVAEAYATVLNATEVRIAKPAEALIPAYKDFGYNFFSRFIRGTYAAKVLGV